MIQKTKDLFRNQNEVDLSNEDAIECLENVTRFAETLIEIYQKQKAKGIDILAEAD